MLITGDMLKVGWSVSSPAVAAEFLKHSVLSADACSGFETWFLAGQRIRMGRWREKLVLVQPSKEHKSRSGFYTSSSSLNCSIIVLYLMVVFSLRGDYGLPIG